MTVRAAVVGVQLVDLVGEGCDADPLDAHEADDVVLGLHGSGRSAPQHQAAQALDLELVEELCGVREVLAVALRCKSHHLSDRQRSSFIAKATQLTAPLCSQLRSFRARPQPYQVLLSPSKILRSE